MQVDYMHVYISQMGRFKRQLLCFKTTPPHGKMNGWVPWSTNLKAMLLMVNAWSAYLLTGQMTCMEAKKAWPLGVAFKGWRDGNRRQFGWRSAHHFIGKLGVSPFPSIKNWLFRVPGGYHGNHLFFLGRIIFFGGRWRKKNNTNEWLRWLNHFKDVTKLAWICLRWFFTDFLP